MLRIILYAMIILLSLSIIRYVVSTLRNKNFEILLSNRTFAEELGFIRRRYEIFMSRRLVMDICPECKSDDVEKTYSMGLRVAVCVILLFVPFGIFICWIPFVFPYTHVCHVCGTELSSDQLLRMDWREKEELLKEHQQLEEKLSPFLGEWIEDQEERHFKVAKGKGQIFLIEINGTQKAKTYRVVDYNEQNDVPEIISSSKVGSKFQRVIQEPGDFVSFDENEHTNETSLTELGKELLTEDEFNHIIDDDLDIHNSLKEFGKNLQKINVEILSDKMEQEV